MAEAPHIQLTVVPAERPTFSPYANSTFTFGYSPVDVTIVFMQAPLFSDDDAKQLLAKAKDGKATASGAVVGSITLPRGVALEFAERLVELLKATVKP